MQLVNFFCFKNTAKLICNAKKIPTRTSDRDGQMSLR